MATRGQRPRPVTGRLTKHLTLKPITPTWFRRDGLLAPALPSALDRLSLCSRFHRFGEGTSVFEKLRHGFQQPGANQAEIEECETKLGITLPDDHKAFLSISNGFNDEVGQGYLVLWSIEELIWADGYEVFELRPHRFLIGSNGGPTAYGVIDGNYISIPFVFAGPWEDEVRVLGNSFEAFIEAIESGEGW
jgi:hypothetical protein